MAKNRFRRWIEWAGYAETFANQECQLVGAQKICLNAWDGALPAISEALDGSAASRFLRNSKSFRIEITRGTYALSGVGARR